VYGEYASDGWEAWLQEVLCVLRSYHQTVEEHADAAVRRLQQDVLAEKLRRVRRAAFAGARAVQEFRSFQKRNRKRKVYTPGDTKCCGCGAWGAWTLRVDSSKWTAREYSELHKWYCQRSQALPPSAKACDLCTMRCPGCEDWFLVEQGVKYGLCLECNCRARASAESERTSTRRGVI
jgi:hypothetical protein